MTAIKLHRTGTAPVSADRLGGLMARLGLDPAVLAAERRALPATAEARLRQLMREIDEIVLPRVLHLIADGREVAQLSVSHRHLIGVEWPGRNLAQETALADHFAACLLEYAETPATLSLRISRRPPARAHSAQAVSVAALETSLGLAPPESSFDRLARMLDAASLARLRWTDRAAAPQLSGAVAWHVTLTAYAQHYRKAGKAPAANASIGALRTDAMAMAITQTEILVIASLADSGIAAILPRKSGLEVIAAWQKAQG